MFLQYTGKLRLWGEDNSLGKRLEDLICSCSYKSITMAVIKGILGGIVQIADLFFL